MNRERRCPALKASKTVVAGALWLALAACDNTPPVQQVTPLQGTGGAVPAASGAAGKDQMQAAPANAPGNAKAKSDEALASRVKAALSADSRLRMFAIDVRAKGGTVELFGTVDSRQSRDQVAALVSSIEGVGSVTNHIVLVSGS